LSDNRGQLPGKGLFGWLGRQIGYVTGAVKHDVSRHPRTIYVERKVQEQPLPQQPNITLRRTTIDEVIEKPKSKS
jgi:hypothetical protein